MPDSQDNLAGSAENQEAPKLPASASGSAADVQRAARKLSDASPESFERVSEFMAISAGMSGQVNPLHQKMNEGHITQVLDLAVKHDERQYDLNTKHLAIEGSNRWFRLVVFLTCVGVLLVVLIMFKDNQSFIEKFIGALFTFGAGFGSGWGFSKTRPKKNSSS